MTRQSGLEDLLRERLGPSGLLEPRFNALVDGEQRTHEVDAFWPEQRVALQVDGHRYHRTSRDRRRDYASNADLELAGIQVLRLDEVDIELGWDASLRRLERRLRLPGR